jgi:hypothetical protein
MAIGLDPKQVVYFEELLMSEMFSTGSLEDKDFAFS